MPTGNTQFSIAVHLMARLAFEAGEPLTSNALATSINASPSFVRRVLSKLSKAGLVDATTGKAGCCILARKAKDISLLDIYKAVGNFKVFLIHDYPARKVCPVSCHIRPSMEKVLFKARKSLEDGLDKIKLSEIVAQIKAAV